VFGGYERESRKTFLVPVPDSTAETLMAVIDASIEPGTTVISDCWGAYRDIDAQGYTHYTVNHSIGFVDQRTSAHKNTIESTWRHVKAYLSPYNRKVDHIYLRGEVQGRESAPIHKIPALRHHNELELMSPRPFTVVRRVMYSWSADIFNCISHRRYTEFLQDTDIQPSYDLTSDHSPIIATITSIITRKPTPRLHNSKTNWETYRQTTQEKAKLSIKLTHLSYYL
jgi:transposase-like protein